MDTTVRSTTHDGVPVLHVSGELDLPGVTRVRQELTGLVATGAHPRVVVDLTGVDFIDSTGLGVLVTARKTMGQQGGSISLVVSRESVRRTLRISALTRLFEVHDDLDSALSHAGAREPGAPSHVEG